MKNSTGLPEPITPEAVLRANAKYVLSLHKLALDSERDLPDEPELVAALNVCWLLEKFRGFWFKNAETERYVCENWSDLPCFSPFDFELFVRHLLLLIDGDSYLLTKKSHDEGIDLIFEETLDINYGAYAKTIVQCKLYRGYIPVADIRDFFGVMTAHVARGLFITTGLLTSQANQFLPMANRSPHANRLHIVTSAELFNLFEIADEITRAIISGGECLDEEDSFDAWCEQVESLKQQARNILWSPLPPSAQRSLF